MKSAPLSRSIAQRRARSAQLAFGVLALGALAVVTLGIPRLTAVPSLAEVAPKPAQSPTLDPNALKPEDRVAVNSDAISERLMQLGNRPQPPAPPPEESGPELPPPLPPADDARFLGVIREPGRSLAMVNVGGKQRIIAEGEQFGGIEVLSIAADAITVKEGGVEKRIEKHQRSGTAISTSAGGASGPGSGLEGVRHAGMNAAQDQGGIDIPTNVPVPPQGRRRPSNIPQIPGVNSPGRGNEPRRDPRSPGSR
ncbi:MAG: hypothetical protein IT435_06545 [Phycisphaerales bacterium]|nr:hypothetical protein [Phycisphaerales bacterium]